MIVWIDDSDPQTSISIAEQVHPDAGATGCNVTSTTQFTLSGTDYPSGHNSGIATTWYTINGTYYDGLFMRLFV